MTPFMRPDVMPDFGVSRQFDPATDCLSGSPWCVNSGASGRDAELCDACAEREDNTHDGRHDRCAECGTEDR